MREILYFQYGFQKAATISFYCVQYNEYNHCFFYSFAISWDFTYISFTYIRFYLPGSLVVAILKSNLERIPKIRRRFEEKSIPPYWAGRSANFHMTDFLLTYVGSRQNQVKSHLGGLAHFSYEHAKFFKGVS